MRSTELTRSAADGAHVAVAYENRKREHLGTAVQCRDEGLQFVPLVVEGCAGGWSPAATQTWRTLSRLLATRTAQDPAAAVDHLQQALGVVLQRENARAVLRRSPDLRPAGGCFTDP